MALLVSMVFASCAYNEEFLGVKPSRDTKSASAKPVIAKKAAPIKNQAPERAPGTIQIWPPAEQQTPAAMPGDELYEKFLATREPSIEGSAAGVDAGAGVLPPPPVEEVIDPSVEAAAQKAATDAEVERLAMQARYEQELAELRLEADKGSRAVAVLKADQERLKREVAAAKAEVAKNPGAVQVAELTAQLNKAKEATATALTGLADQGLLNAKMRDMGKQADEKDARITQLLKKVQVLEQQPKQQPQPQQLSPQVRPEEKGNAAPPQSFVTPSATTEEAVTLFFNPNFVEPFDNVPKEVKVGQFQTLASMRHFKSLGTVTPEGFNEGILYLRDGPLNVAKWNLAGNNKPVHLLLEKLTGGTGGASALALYFEPKGEMVSGGSLIVKTLGSTLFTDGDVVTPHDGVDWRFIRDKQSLAAMLGVSISDNQQAAQPFLSKYPPWAVIVMGGLLAVVFAIAMVCVTPNRNKDRVPNGPADPEGNSLVESRSPSTLPVADPKDTSIHYRQPVKLPPRRKQGSRGHSREHHSDRLLEAQGFELASKAPTGARPRRWWHLH